MAKLSSWRTIYKQDFSDEYGDLIDALSVPINAAMDELYDALDNKLNFTDNINCTIATFTVTVDSTGTPARATQFKLNTTQTSVQGVIALNAVGAKDSSQLPSGGVYISFSKNESAVTIKNIKGLQADIPYSITCLALA